MPATIVDKCTNLGERNKLASNDKLGEILSILHCKWAIISISIELSITYYQAKNLSPVSNLYFTYQVLVYVYKISNIVGYH